MSGFVDFAEVKERCSIVDPVALSSRLHPPFGGICIRDSQYFVTGFSSKICLTQVRELSHPRCCICMACPPRTDSPISHPMEERGGFHRPIRRRDTDSSSLTFRRKFVQDFL
jgi:hypothetical protein